VSRAASDRRRLALRGSLPRSQTLGYSMNRDNASPRQPGAHFLEDLKHRAFRFASPSDIFVLVADYRVGSEKKE
jgi:hypothetical protein